jgi:hypothetical protein
MKNKPNDEAIDPFLRGTMNALKRAGKRARREAEKTGTCLIVDDGQGLVRIRPKRNPGSKI